MPNKLSVEIYVTRENIEAILADDSVEQVVITGDIDILSETSCQWNVEATGYPGRSLAGKVACPQPCPTPKPAKPTPLAEE